MNVINNPNNFFTTEDRWWMIYDSETNQIITEPQQCSGYTSSPFAMVVTDNKEQLDQIILENGLFIEFSIFD